MPGVIGGPFARVRDVEIAVHVVILDDAVGQVRVRVVIALDQEARIAP
jgi:hypothetical protein